MFTSSNSRQNPFSYSNGTFCRESYTYDQNPISAKEQPSFVVNYTSTFQDDHGGLLSQILPPQQPLAIDGLAHVVDQHKNTVMTSSTVMGQKSSTEMANEVLQLQPPCETKKPSRRRNLGVAPRRRTGKKDRHSKICTAGGVRERRMRLSVGIARKFFDLQDMLGFDKASKTIEWLFSKSKKAIKELSKNVPKSNKEESQSDKSHLSEYCEVVLGTEENSKNDEESYEEQSRISPKEGGYDLHHVKGSREEARARARERTKLKMMMIKSPEKIDQLGESNPNYLEQLGSFSPIETLEESISNGTKKSSCYDADYSSCSIEHHHQFANVGIIENYLGTQNFTQMEYPVLFSYQNINDELSHEEDFNSSFLGFPGNYWDTNSFNINSSNDGLINMVPASTCFAASKFPFPLQ